MNNLIVIFCIFVSCLFGWVLKKVKKEEVFKASSKIYYGIIIALNLILLFYPMAFVKKCFLILLVSPLIYQAFMDYETLELSNILSGIVLLFGIAYITVTKQPFNIVNALILGGIYTAFSLLGPVGFGDVKLVFGLGLFVNHYLSLLFYPFLFSVIFEFLLRIFKKNKHGNLFAFGPYIIMAFYVIMIFL